MYCDVRTQGKMTNRVEKMTFFQTFRNCRNIHFRGIWDAFLNVLRCFRRAAAQKQTPIWCEALSYSFMQISTWAKVGLYLDMFLLHMFDRVKWSEADTKNPVRLSSKAHSALKDEDQEGMYCDVRTGGKMTNRVEKMSFFHTFRNCRNIHFR